MNPTNNIAAAAQELVLPGIDGANPLGFLAALGTLRTLSLALEQREVRIAWTVHIGAWRPVLYTSVPLNEENLVALLHERLSRMVDHPALAFADNLNVKKSEFRAFAVTAQSMAMNTNTAEALIEVDFAAAFACDALGREDGTVQDTALRMLSGVGHQDFLKSMRTIVKQTEPGHIRKTLFAPWAYDDGLKNQTMRWDPADDCRYALRWRKPSGDPAREGGGSMLGANRLAIEGLPLVATAPVGSTLSTTGFTGTGARNTFWTWPIWTLPVGVDVCRSLLTHASLVRDVPGERAELRAMGVAAAFRSQRILVADRYRNFAPASAIF